MEMFKRVMAVFLLAVAVFSVRSQVPDLMSYQAVIRNVSNNLVVNKTVGVRISILKGGINGSPVYVETHSVQTNANGMISLYIGNGRVVQGSFSSIDWSAGVFFIKTETDPDGGGNYTISGTSQLLSVPYALYAKSAGNSFDGDYNKLLNAPVLSPVATSGSYNDLSDVPEKQQLSISGSTISLTDGGSIQLPVSFDGDFNNLLNLPDFKLVATTGKYSDLAGIPEKQTLSIKDGSLVISGGEYLAVDPEFFKLPEGFSGKYSDLTGTPGKQKLGIKEGKLVLEGKEEEFGLLELDPSFSALPEGFSGNYKELENKPVKQRLSIKENKLVLEGGTEENDETLLELGESVELPSNSFSGDYNDLKNKPTGSNEGDILYWANNAWTILPIGQEGQVLSVANGKLAWIEPSFANTSASTYKVGDVYYDRNGMPEGIVIEVSTVGRYGKILSLKETSGKQWSIGHKTTGATNESDGFENMSVIKRLTDWETNYPAFAAVAAEGDLWYLPSANEWLSIYENKEQINMQLLQVGGTPFSGRFYWSSTESMRSGGQDDTESPYANGIAMEAYVIPPVEQGKDPVDILAGDSFDDDKMSEGAVRAIRRLSWAETTSKPVAGESYAVGDLYYAAGDKENPIGVVYEVSDGGIHGKIISFDEESLVWSSESIVVGADSDSDGKLNSNKISGIEESSVKYPANAWCSAKGQGWYMPSLNELIAVHSVQYLLNVTLGENGKTPLGENESYWTSTEVDANNSYVFINGTEISSKSSGKNTSAKVRAVYAF
ncbi:hypothetical protein [uncultured Coprobacter sp.]|uniref:hypothetical protein n=1 Tax=uncultured Coprobacter sp. TaxID=1720550 RepID=UPI002613A0F2|nr:hypothetical protein [uncultured Coprobacter sp.]